MPGSPRVAPGAACSRVDGGPLPRPGWLCSDRPRTSARGQARAGTDGERSEPSRRRLLRHSSIQFLVLSNACSHRTTPKSRYRKFPVLQNFSFFPLCSQAQSLTQATDLFSASVVLLFDLFYSLYDSELYTESSRKYIAFIRSNLLFMI